jgi:transcriptional antiterminator NusG
MLWPVAGIGDPIATKATAGLHPVSSSPLEDLRWTMQHSAFPVEGTFAHKQIPAVSLVFAFSICCIKELLAMLAEHCQREAWYALYVRSNFERTTEQCLKNKGYQAFSPFYRTWCRRSDRNKQLELPLFPGYVFCSFNPQNRLPILTTPGIVSIVGAGNIPEPVKLCEILSIQLVAESGRPVQPWPFLRQGRMVRIEGGPLAGVEGTLQKVKDELRLVVSITLMQRSVSVEVHQDLVRPLF